MSLLESWEARWTTPAKPSWRQQARPEQLLPDDQWRIIYFRGGRGSGKTRSSAEGFAELIKANPADETNGNEWGVVAPTFGDARDICMEGDSGLIRALGGKAGGGRLIERGPLIATWNRSMGQLYLNDGTVVYVDGADDGALRVQGKNLRAVWADEIGLWKQWKTAWDESIKYAVRKFPAKRIVSGTPKRNRAAIALVKRLLNDPTVEKRRLRTIDNAANLDEATLEEFMQSKGTALGAQELEGEVLDEVEGALWTRDPDKAQREMLGLIVTEVGRLDLDGGTLLLPDRTVRLGRRVVALDPAEGGDGGDEQGLAAGALGNDGRAYVLHSRGSHVAPMKWLGNAVTLYDELKADAMVVEKNGAMFLQPLFEQQFPHVHVRMVHASQGKRTRAEPVAARYAPGRLQVVHVALPDGGNDLSELETQQTAFTGAPDEDSPGQLDSAVWLLTDLFQLGGPAKSHPVAHERLDRPASLTASEPDVKRRRPATVRL